MVSNGDWTIENLMSCLQFALYSEGQTRAGHRERATLSIFNFFCFDHAPTMPHTSRLPAPLDVGMCVPVDAWSLPLPSQLPARRRMAIGRDLAGKFAGTC